MHDRAFARYFLFLIFFFFFSSRRRHTRFKWDWSSDVCSSDLAPSSAMKRPNEDEYARQEAEIDELYREVILDHYRHPRNRASIESPTVSRQGYNPLCGDEIVVDLLVNGGGVEDVAVRGGGGSIR